MYRKCFAIFELVVSKAYQKMCQVDKHSTDLAIASWNIITIYQMLCNFTSKGKDFAQGDLQQSVTS